MQFETEEIGMREVLKSMWLERPDDLCVKELAQHLDMTIEECSLCTPRCH